LAYLLSMYALIGSLLMPSPGMWTSSWPLPTHRSWGDIGCPPMVVCDRHLLLNYHTTCVALCADDASWPQWLSLPPNLVNGMYLYVQQVPAMLVLSLLLSTRCLCSLKKSPWSTSIKMIFTDTFLF
jgi:hypothetical protein